jgi:thioredoxin 1
MAIVVLAHGLTDIRLCLRAMSVELKDSHDSKNHKIVSCSFVRCASNHLDEDSGPRYGIIQQNFGKHMTSNIEYTRLTDFNFQREVIESSVLTLVVFETDWCGACHIIEPILDGLAIEFDRELKIGRFDFDDNRLIPRLFGVYVLPTLLFFKNGQLIDLIVGAVSKRKLESRLSLLLGLDSSLWN